MKHLCKLSSWVVLILSSLSFTPAGAQTTKTVGASGANYSTLGAAFTAINTGNITGAITLQIIAGTTETASAVLNASGTGSANYTSVTIYPTTTGLTVSGNFAGALIDLNGADNVTIDGRLYTSGVPGSAKDLTLINYSNSNSNTNRASTIRFINDAKNNTVKYCTIKGCTRSYNDPTPTSGIIFFSTTTGTTGNDDNTIEYNDITNAGGIRPFAAIFSWGTAGKENSGINISHNNIFDVLGNFNSNAINMQSYSLSWTIHANDFYETTSFVNGNNNMNCAISSLTGIAWMGTYGSGGHTITNNKIGGSKAPISNCIKPLSQFLPVFPYGNAGYRDFCRLSPIKMNCKKGCICLHWGCIVEGFAGDRLHWCLIGVATGFKWWLVLRQLCGFTGV